MFIERNIRARIEFALFSSKCVENALSGSAASFVVNSFGEIFRFQKIYNDKILLGSPHQCGPLERSRLSVADECKCLSASFNAESTLTIRLPLFTGLGTVFEAGIGTALVFEGSFSSFVYLWPNGIEWVRFKFRCDDLFQSTLLSKLQPAEYYYVLNCHYTTISRMHLHSKWLRRDECNAIAFQTRFKHMSRVVAAWCTSVGLI